MKRALARVGLLCIALIVSLALGECALRLAGNAVVRHGRPRSLENPEKTAAIDAYPSNERRAFPLNLREAATRERLIAMAIPSVREAAEEAPYAVEFAYNAERCRDRAWSERDPARPRVLFVGDSFTEGQGVIEAHTFVRRVAAELPSAEVYNCARRGRDFPALRETFDPLVERYRPSSIVYAMVLNDAEQSAAWRARQAFLNDAILDRRRTGRAPWLGPLDSRLLALVRERREIARVSRETAEWYRGMYGDGNREGWARTQSHLAAMRDRARAAGADFRIVLLPLLTQLQRGRYPFRAQHEEIARAARSLGIPLLDLLPSVEGADERALWVHAVDMHPNDDAHARFARAMLPFVREAASR